MEGGLGYYAIAEEGIDTRGESQDIVATEDVAEFGRIDYGVEELP